MMRTDVSSAARSQKSHTSSPWTPTGLGRGQAPARVLLPTSSQYVSFWLLVLPAGHSPRCTSFPCSHSSRSVSLSLTTTFASLSTSLKANPFISVPPPTPQHFAVFSIFLC